MKLYLTHVGEAMLKALPFRRLPETFPTTVSIFLKANAYFMVRVTTQGYLYANELLAGFYETVDNYLDALALVKANAMEIVSTVEYCKMNTPLGGI